MSLTAAVRPADVAAKRVEGVCGGRSPLTIARNIGTPELPDVFNLNVAIFPFQKEAVRLQVPLAVCVPDSPEF